MFLLPLSLFLVATYVRPRTQAELSYLMTAIECLSGLWCLLFAPFAIQLTLIGWLIFTNVGQFSAFLAPQTQQAKPFQDLSDIHTPTIDVVAQPVHQSRLTPATPEQAPKITSIADFHSDADQNPSTTAHHSVLPVLQPASDLETSTAVQTAVIAHPPEEALHNAIQGIVLKHQHSTLTTTTQVVEMQYRGVTYLKRIKMTL